jgi:ketosteroid isomerase-like protein
MRRGYEAFNRGDVDAMLELIDPDVAMFETPESPERVEQHSHQGVIDYLKSVREVFEVWRLEPISFTENGDKLLVELHQHARGKGSGLEIDGRIFHVWTIRDDKGTRIEAYTDPSTARRVAGLEQEEPTA